MQERQKHIDAAEQQFRQALALDPDNALTLNYLGYMLADHDQKLSEALQLVEHAVKLDPENGAYLDSLGWVHYKLGQYELAEQALEKAITLIPKDPTVHDHLGRGICIHWSPAAGGRAMGKLTRELCEFRSSRRRTVGREQSAQATG